MFVFQSVENYQNNSSKDFRTMVISENVHSENNTSENAASSVEGVKNKIPLKVPKILKVNYKRLNELARPRKSSVDTPNRKNFQKESPKNGRNKVSAL